MLSNSRFDELVRNRDILLAGVFPALTADWLDWCGIATFYWPALFLSAPTADWLGLLWIVPLEDASMQRTPDTP